MWSSVTVDRAHSLHCNNQKRTTRKATPCWPAPYWIPKVSPAAPSPICNHSSVIEFADWLLGPTPHGKTETFHVLADWCRSTHFSLMTWLCVKRQSINRRFRDELCIVFFAYDICLAKNKGVLVILTVGIYAFRNITTTNQNTDTSFFTFKHNYFPCST